LDAKQFAEKMPLSAIFAHSVTISPNSKDNSGLYTKHSVANSGICYKKRHQINIRPFRWRNADQKFHLAETGNKPAASK